MADLRPKLLEPKSPMSNYILDCCALINLYCGWRDIKELGEFNKGFSIGEIALSEAKYAREYRSDGALIQIDINADQLLARYPLAILKITHDVEQAKFVSFANEMDDGEAEALTLALHRGLTLVTDDRVVSKVVARTNEPVKLIGTSDVLLEWSNLNSINRELVPKVIRRITELARFVPHQSDRNYLWWKAMISLT